jgi:hypothetical protein
MMKIWIIEVKAGKTGWSPVNFIDLDGIRFSTIYDSKQDAKLNLKDIRRRLALNGVDGVFYRAKKYVRVG